MVHWEAKLEDGSKQSNECGNGSWVDFIQNNAKKVVGLSAHSDQGKVNIDDNARGYFLSQKVIASVFNPDQVNLLGIGYLNNNKDVVHIKWYIMPSTKLAYTEARSIGECGDFLLRNDKSCAKN